jgi:hypothetical protein
MEIRNVPSDPWCQRQCSRSRRASWRRPRWSPPWRPTALRPRRRATIRSISPAELFVARAELALVSASEESSLPAPRCKSTRPPRPAQASSSCHQADAPRFRQHGRKCFEHWSLQWGAQTVMDDCRRESRRIAGRPGSGADKNSEERDSADRLTPKVGTTADCAMGIVMPKDVVDILKWHVDQLPMGPMRESEWLFPSETGGYRAASCRDTRRRRCSGTIRRSAARSRRRGWRRSSSWRSSARRRGWTPVGRSVGRRGQKQKRRSERDLQAAVDTARFSWGVQDSDL